jgi:alkanesulfonate monooxygenase SsuD/methylene tetrahydromethanopterin reductase-like flavin-dependent oxidoreductase (luciferase family)
VKFGVFSLMQWPEDRSQGAVFCDELLQLTTAEDQGYDSAWLGDQQLSPYGIAPSIHFSAAQLAARTRRIRIGTVVPLLPSFHPLRVAEEVAMLDIMSGGRVDWGVGCEGLGNEFRRSDGGSQDGRLVFREQLEVLKRAWAGGPFSHEGQFFQFPTLECLPTPEQRPHPPIYVAARSPEMLEWAGEAGYPLLAGPFSSADRLAKNAAIHRASAERAGGEVVPFALPTLRQVYCGESLQKAREEAGPALLSYYRALSRTGSAGGQAGAVSENGFFDRLFGVDGLDPDADRDAFLEFLFESCAIVGDEAYCRDAISRLQERVGLDSLLCWQKFGGLPHEAAMASQRRLAEKVIPDFR